jgi:hypothetical protein
MHVIQTPPPPCQRRAMRHTTRTYASVLKSRGYSLMVCVCRVQSETPTDLAWQPPRSRSPTQALPKKMKRLPPLTPPQRLVASLDNRLHMQ